MLWRKAAPEKLMAADGPKIEMVGLGAKGPKRGGSSLSQFTNSAWQGPRLGPIQARSSSETIQVEISSDQLWPCRYFGSCRASRCGCGNDGLSRIIDQARLTVSMANDKVVREGSDQGIHFRGGSRGVSMMATPEPWTWVISTKRESSNLFWCSVI